MKLKQQVVSLELAQKLKKLGVKQESYFYWLNPFKEQGFELVERHECVLNNHHDFYSAFTVAELGEMLPKLDGRGYVEAYKDIQGRWVLHFKVSTNHYLYKGEAEENEADARASMLCYLLENKLITI